MLVKTVHLAPDLPVYLPDNQTSGNRQLFKKVGHNIKLRFRVASLAGYASGGAGHTLYASVKSGLIKFSESIHAECAAMGYTDVFCTALCPGFTWSEFHDVNGTREAAGRMPKWLWMDAEPVVAAGIEAVSRGQPVIVPGAPNKVIAALTRILPEPFGRAMVRLQTSRLRRKT